jgi:hypothetical protein
MDTNNKIAWDLYIKTIPYKSALTIMTSFLPNDVSDDTKVTWQSPLFRATEGTWVTPHIFPSFFRHMYLPFSECDIFN